MEEDAGYPELDGGDAINWGYRGEGAANIVLAYQGSDPLLGGKVLRLKKVTLDPKHVKKNNPDSESGKVVLTEEEQKVWADWPSVAAATSLESLIQAYARDVMSPLLGRELVDPGVIVHVSTEFLQRVAHNVHHARPSWRVNASQIDVRGGRALLISDHSVFWPLAEVENSGLSSISVEIKPKCGFLPNSTLIAAENFIKKKISRFAMHQFLKLSEGQVKVLSCYSPLDLFSGDLERIKRAVNNLFDNPQNNLRVFVQGTSFDTSNLEAKSLYREALNEVLKGCICEENQGDSVDILKELVAQSLYETDAMRNLLAVQKLDVYDIEGAIRAYIKICPNNTDESRKCNTLRNGVDFLDDLSLAESRRIVRDYLISATAKDCSLMLTFQLLSDAVTNYTNAQQYKLVRSSKTGKFFWMKIRFVDLDLKPLNKMPQYYHLDQQIVGAYLTATNCGTRSCDGYESVFTEAEQPC